MIRKAIKVRAQDIRRGKIDIDQDQIHAEKFVIVEFWGEEIVNQCLASRKRC